MMQPVQYYAKQMRNGAPQAGAQPQAAQGAQAAPGAQAVQGAQGAPSAQGNQGGHIVGYGMRGAGQALAPGMQQGYGGARQYGAQMAGQAQAQAQAPGVRVGYGPQHARYAQYAQAAYQAPATSVPQQVQRPRKKRGAGFWVCVVLGLLCLVAAGLILFNMFGQQAARSGTPGQLEGKSPAEIQAELDRIVDEGMFNISIASVVQMANGSAPAELRIENVPGNPYLMKVAITLDDTGQTVYETDAIEPNFHIQQDTLDVTLPAGTYDATATFTALDPDTEEAVGQAAAKVLIQVQS